MAINKVVFGSNTLIDISDTTATAGRIEVGYSAYGANGVKVSGTLVPEVTNLEVGGATVEGTAAIFDEGGGSGGEINLQSKTVSPTESSQTVTPDSGYDGLSSVSVNAISSSYVGTGVTRRSSSDLTASGATVTAPAGYYAEAASKAVASGTEGTPTATKGTVSNHSVSITPSVTNTAGYISGGTKTGTAVSVSASELVSGNKEITSNGTNIDVTEYETVSVNVASSSKNFQVASGGNRVATTSYTAVSGQELTVAVTGTYNVYWSGYRSSTSGTSGSQLYIGSSAYGSVNTTFSNNLQTVKLTGVSLTKDQVVTVRARARGTNYYMYVSNLTIEQTA